MTIGIMTAMPEEAALLARDLAREAEHVHGGRTYYTGTLAGRRVVLVYSRMGKVAAAATAQHLIDVHRVGSILFSGVAGALRPDLRIGDIVIGDRLWQHDMDASPLFAPLEIPLLNTSSFATEDAIRKTLFSSAESFLREGFDTEVGPAAAAELGIRAPKVIRGDIASGDRFVSTHAERDALRAKVPSAACVEMEGGAVAQVCFEHRIPLGVVRVISDGAGDGAHADFGKFVRDAASRYGLGIIRRYLERENSARAGASKVP
ncbi:MAG: 5'-methylthioadenosine/adenosylhomocysteine nucleosidase [Phycisphaerae bacterium]|nr:5'-methylthioadenosine/adenosylhomocysteine nucleosidase [Phycisphaerae bacterium]